MTAKTPTLRVIQVSHKPTTGKDGIRRRPLVIREVIEKIEHQCGWCEKWFVSGRTDTRYCNSNCRHSAHRQREREEFVALRKRARRA